MIQYKPTVAVLVAWPVMLSPTELFCWPRLAPQSLEGATCTTALPSSYKRFLFAYLQTFPREGSEKSRGVVST